MVIYIPLILALRSAEPNSILLLALIRFSLMVLLTTTFRYTILQAQETPFPLPMALPAIANLRLILLQMSRVIMLLCHGMRQATLSHITFTGVDIISAIQAGQPSLMQILPMGNTAIC